MAEKSRWATRQMECPGAGRKSELLLEWKVVKGKKVLHSITCDCPELSYYSGKDCEWVCLEKISRTKK